MTQAHHCLLALGTVVRILLEWDGYISDLLKVHERAKAEEEEVPGREVEGQTHWSLYSSPGSWNLRNTLIPFAVTGARQSYI